MSMTDIPASLRHENNRFAVPGTPIIPEPSIFTKIIFSMVVIPLTLLTPFTLDEISVP
jgi:hypothetical protein